MIYLQIYKNKKNKVDGFRWPLSWEIILLIINLMDSFLENKNDFTGLAGQFCLMQGALGLSISVYELHKI